MQARYIQALLPTFLEGVISILASLAIIGIFYRDTIFAKLTDFSALPPSAIGAQYRDQLSGLNHIAGVQTGFIALFWAGLGVIIYLIYLTVKNLAVGVQNEVIISTTYKQKGSFLPGILRNMLQLVLGMTFIAAVLASASIALPFLLDSFGIIFEPNFQPIAAVQAVAAVIGLGANLYVLWTMLEIVFSVA